MEAAGLVLGAIVLVRPICSSIHETLSSYQAFGRDAERLRLRFAVQQTRLDSFERVLFERGKFAPAMPGRLIDHLPEKTCADVLALLRQLYGVLIEYAAVRAQYGAKDRAAAEKGLIDELLSAEDRIKSLTLDGKKADAAQQRSVSWARKMLWVAFDRSSTERLVGEFEGWAERTQVLLEAAWWPLSFFETVERMRRLEDDADAKSVGLLRGIGLRKLLASTPAAVPAQSRVTEAVAANFTVAEPIGAFELGRLEEAGWQECLVEYKQYARAGGGSAVGDDLVRQRVIQLAGLLNEAPASDPELRVLQCTHYFEDTKWSRFGLVYALPTPCDGDDDEKLTTRRPPVTLATLLDAVYAGPRPSLGARMRLAHKIAMCLRRLHAYSWVHKSLRGENVLLLPAVDAPAGDMLAYSLEEPRIVGFEYARQESDFSDQFGEAEIKRNIYRHPTRWGQPTNRFEKVHDIYGECNDGI